MVSKAKQLLTSKEVLDGFYSYFEKKLQTQKMIFKNEVHAPYDRSSYFCDADGHAPSVDYAKYTECLIYLVQWNWFHIIAKGITDNKSRFVRVFGCPTRTERAINYPIKNEEAIAEKLRGYNDYNNNFYSNVALEQSSEISVSPVMPAVFNLKKLSKNLNIYIDVPKYDLFVPTYYEKIMEENAEKFNSFAVKKKGIPVSYNPEIVEFLAAELEKILVEHPYCFR